MNPNRKRKYDPPQPGGESFQIGEAGPVTYHYPMPPVKSRGQLVPADEWQIGEAGPIRPATVKQQADIHVEAVAPLSRYVDPDDQTSVRRAFVRMLLSAATSTLDAGQHEVFDLMLNGERTIADVAAELGLPRMTVNDRYNAAMAKVRRVLKSDPELRVLIDHVLDEFESRR